MQLNSVLFLPSVLYLPPTFCFLARQPLQAAMFQGISRDVPLSPPVVAQCATLPRHLE